MQILDVISQHLLNKCVEYEVSPFIFSSSAAVYGKPEYLPIDEIHLLKPSNYYGFSKREGEKIIEKSSSDSIIIRTSWLYSMYGNNFVKTMIKKGENADKVYVRYNTNLSRTKYRGIDLYKDLLVHFKDWQICASIDGTGQIGEWIRDGLNYDKWLENFKDGVAIKRNSRQMRLDVTLTLPGLLEVKNLFRLSKRFNVEMLTKVVFTFTPDIVLSPLALPRKLLDEIVDELLDFIEPRADRNQRSLVDVLKNLKTRPNIEETWPDTFKRQLQEGKIYQEDIGRLRKDYKKITLPQILSQDDRLIDWWEAVG